jgi:KDO2-lipid IV(A) lauroyltransferase
MPEYYLIPKRLAHRAPRLATLAQRTEGALFRLVFRLLRRISLARAGALAAALFGLIGPRTAKAEKARANLAIAFPDSTPAWREETTREIFRSLGLAAVELVKLDQIWAQRADLLEFVVEPRAREQLDNRRAAVLVGAHVGAWQVANLLAGQFGLTVGLIYAPESNPAMRELMLGLRGAFGVRLIPSDAGARPLVKELAAGHCIGLAMDTRLDSGKPIPFFGREALTNTSAAGLALRTGAALIPVRAERLPGGRFRVTVYDPIDSGPPGAPAKEQAVAMTTAVNRHFEAWIRETPGEWICLKRRWPKGAKR